MKFTTLIIALALVASVTTAQADALVMTPVMPGIGQHFTWVVGKKYPVVVFFKDGSKRYFLGAFVGYMAVHDSKHSFHGTDWMPTGKPVEVTSH